LEQLDDGQEDLDERHQSDDRIARGSAAVPFAIESSSAFFAYLLCNEVAEVERAIVSVLDILTDIKAALKNAAVPSQRAKQFFLDLAHARCPPVLHLAGARNVWEELGVKEHNRISEWSCNALCGNMLATWLRQTCQRVEHLEVLAATSEARPVLHLELLANPAALVAASERAFACQGNCELWHVSSNATVMNADVNGMPTGSGLLCTLPTPQGELNLFLPLLGISLGLKS
jgi:hypothetical protein